MRTEEPFPPPSRSLCLPLWDTHIHRETRTHSVTRTLVHTQYYSGICLALWSALRWLEAGSTVRSEGGHSTSVLDGECRLTGYCLFTCCILKQICSPLWTYGSCSLLASCAAGRRYVPHVWGFFLLFFLWFYSTSFMEAVMVMVSHSWVAIVKSIPATTSHHPPPFPLLNALV